MKTKSLVIEKYIIWNVAQNKWFRPTYPGFRTDAKGKQTKSIHTQEIFFSQAGEMFMRENDGIDPCDKITHLPQVFDENGNNISSDYIPCVYTGMKDADEKKIYAGHVVRIYPEDEEPYDIEVEYNREAGTWNPHQPNGDNYYSLGECKDVLKWRIQIIGHILENPALLP